MHYTQIKKSDLNFEPLAEFIVEDGGWLDITLISDSPLLEHDAMYMLQNIEKSRHKQLERIAREDRRRALAAQTGRPAEEIAAKEKEQAQMRSETSDEKVETVVEKEKTESKPEKKESKASKKDPKKEDKENDDVFDFEEDDDDLF